MVPNENADRFLSYFQKQFETIQRSELKEFGWQAKRHFKKTLYFGLLDALSRTTSYPKSGNRERFVDFVVHFTNWSDAQRVSLTHLVRLLQKDNRKEFSDIREYSFDNLDKWKSKNGVIYLDTDPTLEEIKKLWPKSIPKPFDEFQPEYIQHSSLLYRYRNSLIHEFREPGYPTEYPEKDDKQDKPFYYMRDVWELVYPLGFYEKLCRDVFVNLKEYYLKNRIDPYDSYSYGTYWIDSLNAD